jgi:3-deoxy-7-phosphoheptulonate synthase
MVELHNHPEQALSDGPQALLPEMFKQLVAEVRAIHQLIANSEPSPV